MPVDPLPLSLVVMVVASLDPPASVAPPVPPPPPPALLFELVAPCVLLPVPPPPGCEPFPTEVDVVLPAAALEPLLVEPAFDVDELAPFPLSPLPPSDPVLPQPVAASAAKAPSCKRWRRAPSTPSSTGVFTRSSLSISDNIASDSRA